MHRCAETKKYAPNERTDQNSRKRAKQRGDSQTIRCRVQNRDNQDAHRNDSVCHKIKEEVKAIQSEMKKNIQGTNSEGKETETQINDLEQKEKSIQPEQNEETRIQKNEERLRKLGDNIKRSNI